MAKVYNYTQPMKPGAINPCNFEPIDYKGDIHILLTVTEDKNGDFHFKSHTNTQGVIGIGLLTGTKYIMVDHLDYEEHSNPSVFPAENTLVGSSKVIGQGTAQDFTLYSIVKFTFNANRGITAIKVDFKSECK